MSEEKWKIYSRKMYKTERRKMKTNLFSYKEYFILHIALSSSHTKVLPTLYYYDSISSLMLSWNVLHRVLFRQKCHYVYHFLFLFFPAVVPHMCIRWCTFICGRVKGLKCKKKKKRKTAKKRKVFVDVIYFRRGGGYGSKCYFICWNCELLFILYSALFMKKYKFTKHNFLYRVGDFFLLYIA